MCATVPWMAEGQNLHSCSPGLLGFGFVGLFFIGIFRILLFTLQQLLLFTFVIILFQNLLPLSCSHWLWPLLLGLAILIGIKVLFGLQEGLSGPLWSQLL